ncbi:MIP transporter [Penicillium cataractarum]|uniref:MIP transporter n=1 Tax=Penicillium cataractarum TaxID=2100454 RepID=A0A9W9SGS8_9EURO|nr:MIP transporter [Penicillium cataractarum]KAJ5378352.1 MIP transporter [Penicillium cataractarum]
MTLSPEQARHIYQSDLEHQSIHETSQLKPVIQPFAGRIGGNQEIVVDRSDPQNAALLKKFPDAAPLMSFREGAKLRGFWDLDLWRFGFIEMIGTMLLVFVTAWISVRPTMSSNTVPSSASGIFSTTAFLGPLFGGIINWFFLTLFIFTFSNVSGSHLNPAISIATFLARLISFPRMAIYVLCQSIGGAIAGFTLRKAYGASDFTCGGCVIDQSMVPMDEAFLLEFMFSLILIFLSFGVGLDPRQGKIYGPALSPFLVGMVLGTLSLASAFVRSGFAGACNHLTFASAAMNPARCFGVFVATSFPTYHWIHWVGPIVASVAHGIVYYVAPPWGH